jgi:hypothetical protein
MALSNLRKKDITKHTDGSPQKQVLTYRAVKLIANLSNNDVMPAVFKLATISSSFLSYSPSMFMTS